MTGISRRRWWLRLGLLVMVLFGLVLRLVRSATEQPKPDNAPSRTQQVASLRLTYQIDLVDGVQRFFEARRNDCPWCGSTQLRVRLRTTDLLQHKPGRFVLEQCERCGHIFQNPRLTPDGLEFYYRDCYDGLGADLMEKAFSSQRKNYLSRAETVRPYTTPRNWLDVGTGHGHFCEAARSVFPNTVFDGLDFTDGVELGAEHGRIDHAYRGQLVELADELAGRYDLVSMFHYLEHTTEPTLELEAARKVVRPGGYLLIDLPDPECRYGRLLGRYWMPWLQPQHLNMIPLGNLRQKLLGLGFTVVTEQRTEAHQGGDLLSSAALAINHLAPQDDLPWFPTPPSAAQQALRNTVWLSAMPLLVAGGVVDRLVTPVAQRARLTNAYRVLAQRH
ncbi:methyltransferase type 12 [Longimycelium tulufanense]|uniref:Methyltransferase type 12 n=1 Tax=Longimycelium tulufanense TaxID=907463 RepID=A0A8J3CDE8_9PSEU|nr:class I SAM-dependent methyltransferase [Longimycelium tulufanense]GGM51067.1 methyltransferase type 12 [Longimycelium tulufanense]